jgi:uncharacterized protein (DUF1499 family)
VSARPLAPCRSGSCVSTQAPRTDPLRRIEPLAFALPIDAAMRAVLAALAGVPRLRILERDAVGVHAVARSAVLRVPLDLEVRVDATAGAIHLRAATPVALRERSSARTRATELLLRIERELRSAP